jgi:mono/diheme cytochrome c family protein
MIVVAGCGGDAGGGGSGTTTSGGGAGDGKTLFAGTCGTCHTLADAGTTGTFGPNLDELKPSRQLVLDAIRTGPGPMPENLLQGAQADAVATYVSSVAGK